MYDKFCATFLFDGEKFLPSPTLVVYESQSKRVVGVRPYAGEDVPRYDGIVCPGFVNAHTHLELAHLRGKIPLCCGLPAFITQVILQRHLTDIADKQAQVRNAIQTMKRNGIVAVGDIANTAVALAEKQCHPDMYVHTFVEVVGFDQPVCEDKIHAFADLLAQHRSVGRVSYGLHAPYSLSKAMFSHYEPDLAGQMTTIHNSECAAENELYTTKTGAFVDFYRRMCIDDTHFQPTGRSSFSSVLPHLQACMRVLFVHNTFCSEQDLAALQQCPRMRERAYFVLCPKANLYIENCLPPVDVLDRLGLQVCIGTDSLASNDTLCVWEEVQCLRTHFPHISIEKMLSWATWQGAQALGVGDTYGKIAPHYQPGFVFVTHTEGGKIQARSRPQPIAMPPCSPIHSSPW